VEADADADARYMSTSESKRGSAVRTIYLRVCVRVCVLRVRACYVKWERDSFDCRKCARRFGSSRLGVKRRYEQRTDIVERPR